jgi:YHS domain-containing protein
MERALNNRIDRRIFLTGIAGAGVLAASPVLAARNKKVRAISNGRSGDFANEGYDATAYFDRNEARVGAPEPEFRWKGGVWRFETEKARAKFEGSPEAFAPQFGGYCTNAMSLRKIVPANPQVWRMKDGKLYLFAAKAGGAKFDKDPEAMIAKTIAHWITLSFME